MRGRRTIGPALRGRRQTGQRRPEPRRTPRRPHRRGAGGALHRSRTGQSLPSGFRAHRRVLDVFHLLYERLLADQLPYGKTGHGRGIPC
ncbi:hypothetical protein [Streptomyces sp. RTGN2]|uniref:hypothetical protein n=1 Tax=Streptomyces sp. RTGN2 TaxID=3016525 RepID=UPI00255336F2|nr:hypothetical protein [Streptomyces sp. RTGN2]